MFMMDLIQSNIYILYKLQRFCYFFSSYCISSLPMYFFMENVTFYQLDRHPNCILHSWLFFYQLDSFRDSYCLDCSILNTYVPILTDNVTKARE